MTANSSSAIEAHLAYHLQHDAHFPLLAYPKISEF
jgi:hypothetical protein